MTISGVDGRLLQVCYLFLLDFIWAPYSLIGLGFGVA